MVYTPDHTPWLGGQDILIEVSNPPTRSNSRRERIQGLGIKGVEAPVSSANPKKESKGLKPPKRHLSARRSFISLLTRSVDSQIGGKFGSSRASRSSQTISPPPVRLSPTIWRTSNPSTTTLTAESDSEDITTYHANLARFQIERAERAAELGLTGFGLTEHELKEAERPPSRDDQVRKTVGPGLGRGLRAHWGGGSSSDSKSASTLQVPTGEAIPGFDEREAFRDWWDKLGSEPIDEGISMVK